MKSTKPGYLNGYVIPAFGYIHAISHTIGAAVQQPVDWQSSLSHSHPAEEPQWPMDKLNTAFTDAYEPLPVFSPEVYSPARKESLDYFDAYTKQETQQIPLVSSSTGTKWIQENSMTSCDPYVPPMFLTNSSLGSMAQNENDGGETDDEVVHPDRSIAPQVTGENSRSLRKGTSGISNDSKTGRQSTRVKDKGKEQQQQLPKYPSSSNLKGHLRGGQDNPRLSHNTIEKQYRTRLNDQFSSLLSVIPPDIIGAKDGYLDSKDCDRRTSKGEVLVLARRYIQSLEQKNKCLQEDRGAMEGEIIRLEAALTQNGRGVFAVT